MTASPSHLLAALALAASLAVTAPLRAQSLGPTDGAGLTPTDTGRVRAGMVAPDFTLESFTGPRVTLSQYRGRKVVLLAFYRGHWWPYCARQLGELRALLTPAQRSTVEMLAVSIDDKEKIQLMLDRVEREYGPPTPDFTFLSDPGHRVIDRYGLLNEKEPRGIPHPTVYVIDKAGVVRWKFTEVNYRIRPTNAMILEALGTVR